MKKEAPLKRLVMRLRGCVAYLNYAVPKGYHMKILFRCKDPISMIEYGPPEASGLPVKGKGIIVRSCIWAHRKAHGNSCGKLLIADMVDGEKCHWIC
ncbi:hypothetical protein AMJ83_01990 [candidate division WOR_3 bacterium SM23_42]|uniref:Uncharacterized protein n=1 Tax=candidate division WOR_3 bacterium SM23_42 TaxID=1703779 RepID=A0A0S8FUZ3_UNCW3|nr:MAG: hypothetical protein AMJ83_01990 [candidate division WOR_3 bacterium SM23_42]